MGIKVDCQGVNQRTLDSKEQRVSEINAAAPDCSCEKYRMSKHSPGVVDNFEILARFIFSPIQFDKKKGKVTPAAFSHVYSKGCSIQRESIAQNDHVLLQVQQRLNSGDNFVWKGVLLAQCHDIRRILVGDTHRAVCVYDTADPENSTHAELCQTQYVIDEADKVELRGTLFFAFGDLISPLQYRDGAVWDDLPQSLQIRK